MKEDDISVSQSWCGCLRGSDQALESFDVRAGIFHPHAKLIATSFQTSHLQHHDAHINLGV